MRGGVVVLVSVFFTSLAFGDELPLAPLIKLDCGAKKAARLSISAVTSGSTDEPTAFVKMVAQGSDSSTCDVRAVLHIQTKAKIERKIELGHNANADFDIVDWSPQHNLILVSSERWLADAFSAPLLFIYDLTTGRLRTMNVGDLFIAKGWRGCSAIIDANGFTSDGRIVVSAGPGSMVNRPRDCARTRSYWSLSVTGQDLEQLPTAYKQHSYGHVVAPAYRPCKSDPGVVDECFVVHGRAQYGNGTPSLRIWRIGTKRMFGVFDPENEIIPDNLAKMFTGFDVSVYGNFEVCPFTKRRPEAMQMFCVESATHLIAKRD